jgi:hypothetical protein
MLDRHYLTVKRLILGEMCFMRIAGYIFPDQKGNEEITRELQISEVM